jgi:hypothetical protein
MQIEEPGTSRRFEEVLAERNGWPVRFAERVADEYFGFLYLAATAGFEVTPSETVDQAWHLHLEWPHYRDVLCDRLLTRPLDHRPGTGEPAEEERYRRQYEETLALYERTFAKSPPTDIWPNAIAEGLEEEERQRFGEEARRLGRRAALGSLMGSIAALAFGATMLAVFLAGIAAIFFLAGHAVASTGRARGSGGCGGGGCGGGGGSSNDCASCDGGSCGGGSCGGGCGGGGD